MGPVIPNGTKIMLKTICFLLGLEFLQFLPSFSYLDRVKLKLATSPTILITFNKTKVMLKIVCFLLGLGFLQFLPSSFYLDCVMFPHKLSYCNLLFTIGQNMKIIKLNKHTKILSSQRNIENTNEYNITS